MKLISRLLLLLLLSSCVPTQIAPKIEDYKVQQGHKFHKSLLEHYAFIFSDPKDAFHFYDYIDTVYELNNQSVDRDVPFICSNQEFYFSFYEAERTTKFINLVPMAIDATLNNEGYGRFLESTYESRKGQWYIVMTVFDEHGNDALHPEHPSQNAIRRYLNGLRKDYLNHENYYEVLLNKNPD